MFYLIYILIVLIFVFLQNPHYFYSLFSVLNIKRKCYFVNSARFIFNFGWLGDLVANSKPIIPMFLSTKNDLIRELPQHLEMMDKALKAGLIYCPSKKGASHDGCFFNPLIGKVTKTVQLKLQEEGSSPFYTIKLTRWAEDYAHLNEINIGFQSPEDFEQNKDIIYNINELQLASGAKLELTSKDYSPFKSEVTCLIDVKNLIFTQAGYNGIVTEVNEKLIDKFGEITNFPGM